MNEPIFLSKGGSLQSKGLLVVNPTERFRARHEAGHGSHKNNALFTLEGCRGTIRPNASGTCYVLTVGNGPALAIGGAGDLGVPLSRLNELFHAGTAWWCKTTNGGGCASLWVVVSDEVAALQRRVTAERDARRAASDAAQAVERAVNSAEMALLAAGYRDGRSYEWTKWIEADASANGVDGLTERALARAAAIQIALDDARIMAELDAEEAAAKEAAAAQAARDATMALAAQNARLAGTTPAAWEAMTPKQQGLALHRARLAGRIA